MTPDKDKLIERFDRRSAQAEVVAAANRSRGKYRAVVVVVEGSQEEELRLALSPQAVLFVGESWEVVPIRAEFQEPEGQEFDTLNCLDQHPER
jgi:3-dehydroquinate synthase class II